VKAGNHLRDILGFCFFTFATLVSAAAAWDHPSLLAWLYVTHNGLLAGCYLHRSPAKSYDRTGLWLALVAALLPTLSTPGQIPWYGWLPGLLGYALILWSLITLGPRFGIAPADRGLTSQGPYRLLRHPMYQGELLFRVSLVFVSDQWWWGAGLALLLAVIQCWRIIREERLLEGYGCYARLVPWRLLPGVW